MRRWVCRLQLLLALASAVILRSEFHGTRDHILLSQIRNSLIRRLLRLAGLRWSYSTSPPHGMLTLTNELNSFITLGETEYKSQCLRVSLLFCAYLLLRKVPNEPLPSNGLVRLVVMETCLPNHLLVMDVFVVAETCFWLAVVQ
jgi:hypothetical protein